MSLNTPKGSGTPMRRLGLTRRFASPQISPSPNRFLNSTPITTTPLSKATKRSFSESKLLNDNGSTTHTPAKLRLSLGNEETEKEPLTDREAHLKCLEKKLASLENVTELKNDLEMWREGCKEALLELQQWLASKEDMKMSCADLAKKLGIWNVINDNFHDDPDILTEEELCSETI